MSASPQNKFSQDLRKIIAEAREAKVQFQHVVCEMEVAKQELIGDMILQSRAIAAQMTAQKLSQK